MSGDSSTAESLQSYILGIYKEYVESVANLRKYLLAKYNGGQNVTFKAVFESFFHEFVRLFDTTKHLTSATKANSLKTRINAWLEASYCLFSESKKQEWVAHAKSGITLADEWAEVLHAEEIIRKTDL